MPASGRIFRIFVSSTFSDLKEERNALQERVFPRLRKLCEEHGCRFQAIDLRWGVSEEAALDNRTMQICFEEIERSQRTTPRPNFIVLLGNRYGWRPLPEEIPAEEFEEIERRVTSEKDHVLLSRWYRRDDNNVPPVSILQPRNVPYDDFEVWDREVQRPLLALLEGITGGMDLDESQLSKYTTSATEQEIERGALSVPDADEHVFCYFRDIAGFDGDTGGASAAAFFDIHKDGGIDEDAATRLEALKEQLTSQLPGNIREYSSDWIGEEEVPITLSHIDRLCEDVEMNLTRVIETQLVEVSREGEEEGVHLREEIEAQHAFARERAKFFIGRGDLLGSIDEYIGSSVSQPLVIYGESGSGKSALMARAFALAQESHPSATVIPRFIGATPSSSDIRMLLEGLGTQIADAYGDEDIEVPGEYQELVRKLPEFLALATEERPLVLFLDALDQLGPANNARQLGWLPRKLHDNVSLIVSVMDREGADGECLRAAQNFLPADRLLQLAPLAADEGESLLATWLDDASRTLQPQQRDDILTKFSRNGLPLYLKLAFEEAKRWRSYAGLPCGADDVPGLAEDISGISNDLFARLELPANHGPTLVSKALGYLIAAKNGLTEDEMLNLLTLDQEVMTKRSAFWPDANRLPVIIWSRLYFDLEPYLAEQRADHTTLFHFYHRQLQEVATERYCSGDAKTRAHRHLAGYFSDQNNWHKTVPLTCVDDFKERIPNYRKTAELPYQQAYGGLDEDYYRTLTDFDFIDAKNAGYGPFALIEDYDRVSILSQTVSSQLGKSDHQALGAIRSALQLSVHVLIKSQDQMASQMYGRLMKDKSSELESFLEYIRYIGDRPWIRPINSSLSQAGGQTIQIPKGHTGSVNTVAVTPDGTRAVSGSDDETLRVWDLSFGEEVATLKGHTSWVTAVAVTPDGTRAVSASNDKTLRVWDLSSGKTVATLVGHKGSVTAVAVTPDGTRAVSGSGDKTLRVWDLSSGKTVVTLAGHIGWIEAVAVTPDGTRAVSASVDRTLRVWDLVSAKPVASLAGHSKSVNGVAVTPDGTRAVSGSGDKTLRVWDLSSGKEIGILEGHTDWVNSVTVTPDCTRVVSASGDKTLRVWDLSSGKTVATLVGHSNSVNGVAVTPDGTRAVSGSGDKTLRVWDLSSRKALDTLAGHTDWISAVAVTPDGTRAVSTLDEKTLSIWDLSSGKQVATLAAHFFLNPRYIADAVAVTPDGTRAVLGSRNDRLYVWDLSSGKIVGTLVGHTGWVNAVAVTPDGTRAVSASLDGTLRVWNLSSGKTVAILVGHSNSVNGVMVTPDGTRAVSGSGDKTHRVWDLSSGKLVTTLAGHTDGGRGFAVTPDGTRVVSGSDDNTLCVWDLSSGKLVTTLAGHTYGGRDFAVTPDGTRVVSESDDNTLCVWDLSSGKLVATLAGRIEWITAVAVTTDGRRAVSVVVDRTLRVWDLSSCKVIADFSGDGKIIPVAYSHHQNNVIARGDGMLLFHLENIEIGPPILNARYIVAEDSYTFDCVYCQQQSQINVSDMGKEISCPRCGRRVKLNPVPFDVPPREIKPIRKVPYKQPDDLKRFGFERI